MSPPSAIGPSDATGATVVVGVPVGLTGASVALQGAGGTCDVADGRATCVIDRIAAGAQATVSVSGTLALSTANTPLALSATVTASGPDGDHANDRAGTSVDVGAGSNLGLAVMAPTDVVLAGQVADFSRVVNNVGPSDAHDVVVTHVLPVGARTIDLDGRCQVDGRVVTCTLGTVTAGQQIVLEFEVKATQALDGATLGSKATINSSTGDVDGADNSVVRPDARCLSRRNFDIRLRVPDASRRISVKVGARPAKVWRRKGRIRALVDLRGRLTSRVTVRIAAITPRGYKVTGSRRYRTCDIRRPTVRPPKLEAARTTGSAGTAARDQSR